MTVIQRSALVSYPARQMFELVNTIEEYPRFLPWCAHAKVIHSSDNIVEASLEMAWSGMRKSFITRNELKPFQEMRMKLVSGPFRHFEGIWTFESIDDSASRVSLHLEFEAVSNWLGRLFQPVFHRIADSLVEAFCRRASEVYGISSS